MVFRDPVFDQVVSSTPKNLRNNSRNYIFLQISCLIRFIHSSILLSFQRISKAYRILYPHLKIVAMLLEFQRKFRDRTN